MLKAICDSVIYFSLRFMLIIWSVKLLREMASYLVLP